MGPGIAKTDKFLVAAIIIAIAYFSYLAFVYNYRFVTFQEGFYDIGIQTYSMYWHLHGSQYTNPSQYLVFGNHISPFFLLVLPLFAVHQDAITLVFVQDMFLALTAVAVYFVSRELIRSKWMSFGFFAIFVVSTGVRGLTTFDFHVEAFAPLFVILAFYFYMKEKPLYFFISYIFLLSLVETSFAIGLSLLLGLLAYEMIYTTNSVGSAHRNREKRLKIIGAGIVLSLFAFGIYFVAMSYIIGSYSGTSYTIVPPYLRPINYLFGQLNVVLATLQTAQQNAFVQYQNISGIIVVFLSFGITVFGSIVPTLLFLSPWIVEVFIVHNYAFAYPSYQYYGYVEGNCFVAALLGYIVLSAMSTLTSRTFGFNSQNIIRRLAPAIVITSLMVSLFTLGSFSLQSFVPYGAPHLNYSSVSSGIAMVPANAVVMAQSTIASHMTDVYNLEQPPTAYPVFFEPINTSVFWTEPQYIVFDKDLPGYQSEFNTSAFDIYGYMSKNYTEVYNSSGLYVYKRVA